MSLSDRYNRGGGRIQSFDQYLTYLGDRIGNLWWNQTGIRRSVLTQSLYVASAWAATQHFTESHNPIVLVFLAIAMISFVGATPSMGGLVEQIQSEAAGLPRNALAIMRLEILGFGIFHLMTAFGEIAAKMSTDEAVATQIGEHILLGLSLTALQMSDYIRRTNPPTPGNGGRGGLRRVFSR